MALSTEERDAAGICRLVSNAQAETLMRLRASENLPDARFASQVREDKSRAVVTRKGSLLTNLDVDGFAVEVVSGRWQRIGARFDPPR
jgi:hypothetical protein